MTNLVDQPIDEQSREILRDSVESTLRRLGGTKLARALQSRDSDAVSSGWDALAQSGWTGILIPEECGGTAAGIRAAATVAEELGRYAIPAPYTAQCVLPIAALANAESSPLRSDVLSACGSGQARVALAWQESAQGAAVDRIHVKVAGTGKRARLTGRKLFVAGADSATDYMVTAKQRDELLLYVLPAASARLHMGAHYAVDGTCYGTIDFDRVPVQENQLVATGAAAKRLLDLAFEHALAVASAELVGLMREALEMTLGYMRNRVQFGRPIGSFQALQHRAAELFVQKELSSSVLQEAIELVEAGGEQRERAIAVRRAKARCSDAALRIVKDAVQLHGAIGYTDEYDLSLYLKRAMVLSSWLGNGVSQRREYVRLAYSL